MPLLLKEAPMKEKTKSLTDLSESGLRDVYVAAYSPHYPIAIEMFPTEEEAHDWLETQAQLQPSKTGRGLILRRELLVDGVTMRDFDERVTKMADKLLDISKEAASYGWKKHQQYQRHMLMEIGQLLAMATAAMALFAIGYFI